MDDSDSEEESEGSSTKQSVDDAAHVENDEASLAVDMTSDPERSTAHVIVWHSLAHSSNDMFRLFLVVAYHCSRAPSCLDSCIVS